MAEGGVVGIGAVVIAIAIAVAVWPVVRWFRRPAKLIPATPSSAPDKAGPVKESAASES